MPVNRTRILVVDDRQDHGECIARVLWSRQIPVLFFKYDEEQLLKIEEEGDFPRHHGVRVILFDINLSGSGSAGHDDYTRAENVVKTLLHDNNGPWALITWSTFDGGHSKELYKHLCERLPVSIRPISVTEIDKTPYVVEDNIIPNELSMDKFDELTNIINEALCNPESLHILGGWERSVYACASEVVSTLAKPALDGDRGDNERNFRLLNIISELVKIEADQTLDTNNISDPLYSILGQVLLDRVVHTAPSPVKLPEIPPGITMPENGWKVKLNTMLHWDSLPKEKGKSQPGAIFLYPMLDEMPQSVPLIPSDKLYAFKRMNFICDKFDTQVKDEIKRKEIVENCKLVLLDITPPCDHAQNKSVWRSFVVGLNVPEKHKEWLTQSGKVKGENILPLPDFMSGESIFRFHFNSRLTLAILDDQSQIGLLGESSGRLREQILRDIMHWIGRQITRPGHTAF